jgi:Ca2+-binding EF-hand superfamily protein
MREHERFLRVFISLFRKIDRDNDGILSEKEFIALINEIGMCNTQEEITYFL